MNQEDKGSVASNLKSVGEKDKVDSVNAGQKHPSGSRLLSLESRKQGFKPTRFEIRLCEYGYLVSVPNYHGGEVVTAEVYDVLVEAATKALAFLVYMYGEGSEIDELRAALARGDVPDSGQEKNSLR